jgi:hypothetical protein
MLLGKKVRTHWRTLEIKINITPEASFEYSEAVEALQRKRDEVTIKLHGISFASDDEWEDLKIGTNNVLDEVRTMFHETIVKILCELTNCM